MSSISRALFNDAELAMAGEMITSMTLDSNIVIFVGEHREHELRIENEIQLVTSDRNGEYEIVVRYDPYNRQCPIYEHLTELASIVNHRVVHAFAFLNGELMIELEGKIKLIVEPLDKYEACMYTFGSYILACPPGGFSQD